LKDNILVIHPRDNVAVEQALKAYITQKASNRMWLCHNACSLHQ